MAGRVRPSDCLGPRTSDRKGRNPSSLGAGGGKLFYYNLPKVADGDYELWAQYNVDGGAWQSIRWAYGQCHYYKIRISGTKVTVLGRYSNTPDGTVFGYTLNITSLPVFNNEAASVSIGANIISTFPNAHAITLAPRICTYEQREDGWYYIFKTRFPAKSITLNKASASSASPRKTASTSVARAPKSRRSATSDLLFPHIPT